MGTGYHDAVAEWRPDWALSAHAPDGAGALSVAQARVPLTRRPGCKTMSRSPAMKNFHLPLPDGTYDELRAEAERAQLPVTTVAREAISSWLQVRKKTARRQAVMEYAARMAGSRFDLDAVLEAAAIEELMRTDREAK